MNKKHKPYKPHPAVRILWLTFWMFCFLSSIILLSLLNGILITIYLLWVALGSAVWIVREGLWFVGYLHWLKTAPLEEYEYTYDKHNLFLLEMKNKFYTFSFGKKR